VFYDIGATSTKALLVTFQSVPDVKAKKNKTIAQVLVRAITWDETLGGRFLDQQLANHFKQLIKSKYVDVNIDDQRLTLRLLKEAAKVKEILSANQQTQAVG
jgi:hypoxia up-regulated 1